MEETSYIDDFFSGMGDGNQTEPDAEEETVDTEPETDTGEVQEETEDTEETADGGEEETPDDNGGEESAADTQPVQPEQFTLRVNHEDKIVTREEMTAYAQKGIDYDRVKTQLEQAKSDNAGLSAQLAEANATVDVLKGLAAASGMTMEQLIQDFEVSRYKSQGMDEETAKLAVERDHLKKERDQLQNRQQPSEEESRKAKIDKEVDEFMQKFPETKLDEELISKLMPDIHKGMSITDAYYKMQKTADEARIADLTKQLANQKQNAQNRASSPGSLNDSGRKKSRNYVDDFFSNL